MPEMRRTVWTNKDFLEVLQKMNEKYPPEHDIYKNNMICDG